MAIFIPVQMALDDALHCPFCGTQTLGNDPGVYGECEHLLFVATGEGGLEWSRADLAEKLGNVDFNNELSVKRIKIGDAEPKNFFIFNVYDFEFGVYVGYEKED